MNRREFNQFVGTAAISPAAMAAADDARAATWSLEANLAECCSCEIPCPCNFGRPTELRCDGNRLVEIVEGDLDGEDLAGLRFLVTFEMGKWTRIYIDERLSESQHATLDKLLPLAFAGFVGGARAIERVPLTVTRTDDLITITAPESRVEMKPLAGLEGSRITIDGLPSNTFHDYVQYESVVHTHDGPDDRWSHSGTNGFTSRMIASS